VLQTCNDDNGDGPFAGAQWENFPCAIACREVAGVAVCLPTRDPDPECAGGGDFMTCLDNAPTHCFGGYAFKETPCASPSHCAMSAACGGPICVTSDSPDPRCAQRKFCDGNDYVTCTCDYVSSRFSCGATETCRAMDGDVLCTPAEPDPRCSGAAQTRFGFCDGNVAYDCWYGYLVSASACAPPSHCDVLPTVNAAGCAYPIQ